MKNRILAGELYTLLKPFRKVIACIALSFLFAQLLQLASPYILGRVVNAYLGKAPMWVIVKLAGLGLLAFIVKNLIVMWRDLFEIKRVENPIPLYLSQVTMQRLLSWSIAQHKRNHSGVIQSIVVE